MERKFDFEASGRRYTFDSNTMAIYLGRHHGISSYTTEAKREMGHHLRSVALVLSNECNLLCGYCYANKGTYDSPGARMSFEDGAKAIDLLHKGLDKGTEDRMTVGFFGGEPLLCFELIKKLVAYTEQKSQQHVRTKYLLTTNGTLITEEMAEYFRRKNFIVTISIDGDRQAHDLNRLTQQGVGTHESVVGAIDLLMRTKVRMVARITVSKGNTDVFSAVKYLFDHGVDRITFADDHAMSREAFGHFLTSLGCLVDWYFSVVKRGEKIDITNFSEPLCAIATKTKKVAHCSAGITYITVSADGKIYRCPRFIGTPAFQLDDHVPDEYDAIDVTLQAFRQKLGQNAGTRNRECGLCAFVNLCGGICYHHSHIDSGQEFSRTAKDCSYRKLLYQKLLVGLCSLATAERRNLFRNLIRQWS